MLVKRLKSQHASLVDEMVCLAVWSGISGDVNRLESEGGRGSSVWMTKRDVRAGVT